MPSASKGGNFLVTLAEVLAIGTWLPLSTAIGPATSTPPPRFDILPMINSSISPPHLLCSTSEMASNTRATKGGTCND
jgi:hypothetical protein